MGKATFLKTGVWAETGQKEGAQLGEVGKRRRGQTAEETVSAKACRQGANHPMEGVGGELGEGAGGRGLEQEEAGESQAPV